MGGFGGVGMYVMFHGCRAAGCCVGLLALPPQHTHTHAQAYRLHTLSYIHTYTQTYRLQTHSLAYTHTRSCTHTSYIHTYHLQIAPTHTFAHAH